MTRTSGGFMGTSCLLENLVTAARIGIFSPCEVLSGTGTSAQTSSHLLSLSLEGFEVRDLKLYRASQQRAVQVKKPGIWPV